MTWVAFRYREFHDRPRCVRFESGGTVYFLLSEFLADSDDYDAFYRIFVMPRLSTAAWEGTWEGMEKLAIAELGRVAVGAVVFDPTLRAEVNTDFLGHLG